VIVWICAGQFERFCGSTGPEQQTPLVVTFAGAQHAPLAVGIPDAQHCGPGGSLIGMMMMLTHWLLLGPLGACPAGQQMPVEVTLLARQQAPPTIT
jgi:hypothetical protein